MDVVKEIDKRIEKITKMEDQLATAQEELKNFLQVEVVGETIKMKNGFTANVQSIGKQEGVFYLRVKWNNENTESYIYLGDDEFTIEEE